jgi:predicted CopG family antitoxin
MKNLTITLDDDTYDRACAKAEAENTSVSRLVERLVTDFASSDGKFERLKRRERELRELVTDFDGSDRVSRDALHDRRLA